MPTAAPSLPSGAAAAPGSKLNGGGARDSRPVLTIIQHVDLSLLSELLQRRKPISSKVYIGQCLLIRVAFYTLAAVGIIRLRAWSDDSTCCRALHELDFGEEINDHEHR